MIEALERDLPPATLLLGPDLTRMVREAYGAMLRHGVQRADAQVYQHVSAADARAIVRFAQTAPFGKFKVVAAVLDGSTPVAQNILLKVLEEPPKLPDETPAVRFILVATERPLPTITSRCQVITVAPAQRTPEFDADLTRRVNAALTAAQAGDLTGLDKALAGWGDAHHAVLSLLLAEAAAGRDPDAPLPPGRARKLLGELGRLDSANPRLAAHAALVSVLVP